MYIHPECVLDQNFFLTEQFVTRMPSNDLDNVPIETIEFRSRKSIERSQLFEFEDVNLSFILITVRLNWGCLKF